MNSNDYRAGDNAQNAPGPNDARLEGSLEFAGEINRGQSSICLPGTLLNSTPEWKCARLEPQVGQLLESMKDAVIAHDSGVIIGFNQRVPELLGCPSESILWRRLGKFMDPVSLPTLARWIDAPDRYSILVNGVRANGDFLLLRLEAIASLLCPGGRPIEVVTLVEFAPARRSDESRQLDRAPWNGRP